MTSILTIIQQQDEEYDRLHALYEEAKHRVEDATTPEELEAATIAFHPIQQAFLRNREQAVPTECYQIIASFLDCQSRARLAQCDKHLHYQVIYGKYSARFVWSEGRCLLEQRYRRRYDKDPHFALMTPLLHATVEGTMRAVRVLVEAKANLAAVNDDFFGYSSLHFACQEGHEEVVGLLIDAGANVNAMTYEDRSPLHFATLVNSLPIVRRLLTAQADPNLGEDYSPLHTAAKNSNRDIASALLEAKADVNWMENEVGNTPLHTAAVFGATDVIPILLAAPGANVDRRNDDAATSLTLACKRGHVSAVEALLAANADPNIVDENGIAPLQLACHNEHIVRLLSAAMSE